MMIVPRSKPLGLAIAALASALLMGTATPLAGQDRSEDARLRKLESEVRALQRKVFPGADGRLFEPQIAPGAQSGPGATTTPSLPTSTAVTDILVRLDALEVQLQALTAKGEEQANTLALMEARLAALETANGAPLVPASAVTATPALTPAPASGPAVAPTTPMTSPAAAAARSGPTAAPAAQAATPPSAATPAPSSASTAAAAAPSAQRLAAVQAIAKPQTADPGDDEYSYGFRLWNAGFFPEARQQLTRFVEQYPKHPRISFGRNLLGRAFLDDAMPEEAARWFLRNYQADRNGDRAPDSLLYLGKAMIALKDTRRACIALAEFAETYPALASGRLANDYQGARRQVTCQ